MTKRLQVLFEDTELSEIHRFAKRRGMTTAEWVRHALREARDAQTDRDVAERLSVLRAAARHRFPTGDIEQMLSEIESRVVPISTRPT